MRHEFIEAVRSVQVMAWRRSLFMEYREEKGHPLRHTSLRSGEELQKLVGDPVAEKRDMVHEQRAAFKSPAKVDDPRVTRDESDQGRTR